MEKLSSCYQTPEISEKHSTEKSSREKGKKIKMLVFISAHFSREETCLGEVRSIFMNKPLHSQSWIAFRFPHSQTTPGTQCIPSRALLTSDA